jgi:hypothetical protein
MLIEDQVGVSAVFVYKIWWALVGTVSDFAKLLQHKTTKTLAK